MRGSCLLSCQFEIRVVGDTTTYHIYIFNFLKFMYKTNLNEVIHFVD